MATFAYFTATASTDGDGGAGVTDAKTANMGSQTLNMTGLESGGNMTYPGGIMVAGVSVTATVTGDNAYDFTYKINATIDTSDWEGSSSNLQWTLYETTSSVESPLFTGCTLSETGLQQNPKQYYYEDCAAAEGITSGSTQIATGSVTAGDESSGTFDITANTLKFDNISSSTEQTKYFYLVVKYENGEDQTTTDSGHNASLKINSIKDAVATLHTT